jgi:two-component system chemotaxis sensor kinase CheA
MIERIQHIFIEETTQQLTLIESLLDSNNAIEIDADMIEKIFLVMHTIKGSGPMFGFSQLPLATHPVEKAFAKVRNGELGLSDELISRTNHVVKILIDALNKKSDALLLQDKDELINYFNELCS